MSREWTKWRRGLPRSKKVLWMAELLDTDVRFRRWAGRKLPRSGVRKLAAAAVVEVWAVAQEETRDGFLPGLTLAALDDLADLPGLGQAMAIVGWAVQTDAGVALPEFLKWNKPDEVRRQEERERKQGQRVATEPAEFAGTAAPCPADVPRDIAGTSTPCPADVPRKGFAGEEDLDLLLPSGEGGGADPPSSPGQQTLVHFPPAAVAAPARAAPTGEHQAFVSWFTERFEREHGGKRPTWNGKTGRIVKELLARHGPEELRRRAENLFRAHRAGEWYASSTDVPTLAAHIDKLARAPARSREPAAHHEFAGGRVAL